MGTLISKQTDMKRHTQTGGKVGKVQATTTAAVQLRASGEGTTYARQRDGRKIILSRSPKYVAAAKRAEGLVNTPCLNRGSGPPDKVASECLERRIKKVAYPLVSSLTKQ